VVTKTKVPNPGVRIRYSGLFDFDGLYSAMADWFKRYRYYLHEEMYKHKVPSPLGAEQEMFWYADSEVSEYIKFKINVYFHLWDMTEVEVVKDGKKRILTNARIEIKIWGDLITDWQDKFEKNKFTRMLRGLYNSYMLRREVESYWGDMLIYRIFNLQSYVKKYLDMQTASNEYEGYLGENR
jgi:hypothetical protein